MTSHQLHGPQPPIYERPIRSNEARNLRASKPSVTIYADFSIQTVPWSLAVLFGFLRCTTGLLYPPGDTPNGRYIDAFPPITSMVFMGNFVACAIFSSRIPIPVACCDVLVGVFTVCAPQMDNTCLNKVIKFVGVEVVIPTIFDHAFNAVAKCFKTVHKR